MANPSFLAKKGMDFEKYCADLALGLKEAGYRRIQRECWLDYVKGLYEKGLPIIMDQQHLSDLLGYELFYLRLVCNGQHYHYKEFKIPKKNGKLRTISEPLPSLKEIQEWILDNILYAPFVLQHVSPVAHAFLPNKNIKTNAAPHLQRRKIVCLDIHDFFGTVSLLQVYNVFHSLGYNEEVAMMLSNLTTKNGHLPQGAPTSPMLSNIIFAGADRRIGNFCVRNEITYTRYADDMTFSGNIANNGLLIELVRKNVEADGFQLNNKKTHVMGKGCSQHVTGIVVNQKLQVAKGYRKKIRQEMHYIQTFGVQEHLEKVKSKLNSVQYVRHLYGKINHVLYVNPQDKEMASYYKWMKERFGTALGDLT